MEFLSGGEIFLLSNLERRGFARGKEDILFLPPSIG
jgi:hypothetical protein